MIFILTVKSNINIAYEAESLTELEKLMKVDIESIIKIRVMKGPIIAKKEEVIE